VTAGADATGTSGSGVRKTDLAATRTILAAERTLMAWIRTALSMIGFGFTIFKFLHGLQAAGNLHLHRPEGPRIIGLFLAALGTGSLLAGIVQYVQTLASIPGARPRLGVAFYVACAVVVLGVVVLIGLVSRAGPL
jgi:putative membrane protein